MMIRCRIILRLVFFLFSSWLLLAALWLALPSPSVETDDPTYYTTTVLKAGKTLTRIYEFDDFFPYYDQSHSVQRSRATGRNSFAIDYALDIATQSLRLGPNAQLNITPPILLPFVSPPFKVSANSGDQDGITPPWFSHADATLLYGQADIHGQDVAYLHLRALWTGSGRLELWPDSQNWVEDGSSPPNLSPLLSLENYTGATQAQFRAIPPTDKPSSSPSYTYPLRKMILKALKPTGLALWSFLCVVGDVGAGLWVFASAIAQWLILYMAVVALVWWAQGRPPFHEFFATSPLTRFIHRRLISNTERQANAKELMDVDSNKEHPKPLSSIGAFFRSRSPLDDLLFTFAFTRYLTQPLIRSHSSTISGSSSSGREVEESDLEAGFGIEKSSGKN